MGALDGASVNPVLLAGSRRHRPPSYRRWRMSSRPLPPWNRSVPPGRPKCRRRTAGRSHARRRARQHGPRRAEDRARRRLQSIVARAADGLVVAGGRYRRRSSRGWCSRDRPTRARLTVARRSRPSPAPATPHRSVRSPRREPDQPDETTRRRETGQAASGGLLVDHRGRCSSVHSLPAARSAADLGRGDGREPTCRAVRVDRLCTSRR
jgi:hypothetical protein